MADELRKRIYAIVRAIPRGAVTRSGAVARRDNFGARQGGYGVASLPAGTDVPWHRVLNSKGEVSIPGEIGVRQRALLAAEGVTFDARGRVDFDEYGADAVRDRTETRRA